MHENNLKILTTPVGFELVNLGRNWKFAFHEMGEHFRFPTHLILGTTNLNKNKNGPLSMLNAIQPLLTHGAINSFREFMQ